MRNLAFCLLCLAACRTRVVDFKDGDDTGTLDADGDGFLAPDDCDDQDPAVHPGAPEVCDGRDQDCDGEVDEDPADPATWYLDFDGDGWGTDRYTLVQCEEPSGYTTAAGDCDDTEATVHPGAEEHCDGLDEDCDAEVDEDAVDAPLWSADADGDGYGDPVATVAACTPGSGAVEDATDCDDGDPAVNPGADEVCDGVDDDCDGEIDEPEAADAGTWHPDADGDGWGDPEIALISCARPGGYLADGSDCDDADPAVHPGAPEVCDGYDNDCDGLVDDADPAVLGDPWYADTDGDGWGDLAAVTLACAAPAGHVADPGDCDDTDTAFHPGAPETDCTDPNDYNCDGSTGYADADGDGYAACEDCDDADPTVSLGGTWYGDADGDGYGVPGVTTTACGRPAGFSATADDCDDADASFHPGAPEACDGLDQDCDGIIDEDGTDPWYADADGDGYGDATVVAFGCTAPSGFVADDTDCDDTDAAVNPGAAEVCGNGVDDDCDGLATGCGFEGEIDLGEAEGLWWGTGLSASAGDVLAPAGDADGDGLADFWVGQPEAYAGGPGRAFLVLGSSGGAASLSGATAMLVGQASRDYAGSALAGGVDADGDGASDVLVGAWNHAGRGAAYLVLGPVTGTLDLGLADAIISGRASGDDFGTSVAFAGDLDGDGSEDLLIGADSTTPAGAQTGTAYLFSGPLSGAVSTTSATTTIDGIASCDCLGRTALGAGDLDGDGQDDIVVSISYGHTTGSSSGEVLAYLGPLRGSLTVSDADAVLMTSSLRGSDVERALAADDLDGDGYDDLLLGGYGDSSASRAGGAAYVVLGPVSGAFDVASAAARLYSEEDGATAGWAGDMGGDVDGDGAGDVVVGAYLSDLGGADAGAAYLFYGPVAGAISLDDSDAVFVGEDPGDDAGISVLFPGDADGDGVDDLVVGAIGADDGGGGSGAVYLLLGGGI
ncbi:MAG: MopE-related protein [Pseudomonadota bacterium]